MFTVPDTAGATSTLRLRQKVKRDKLSALYRHLNVTGTPDLTDLDSFRLTKDPKKGVTIFDFYNRDRWVPLTKQTGEFFAPKTLRDSFGRINAVKKLGIDTTPPLLERSLKAATKLSRELPTDLEMESIPLEELSSLVEDIHAKTPEASQNTDLDMRDRLHDLNTAKQARLEIFSRNQKDPQTQVARIKQTIEKVLDQNTPLAEIIRTLFSEQGITIFSMLNALSMTISTIDLTIKCVLGGVGGGTGGSSPKDEGVLKKWLDRLADALKRLAGKIVEALPVIVGSVVGTILSFLGKTVGFVAEHTWALIVFVAGLVGWWLMQKVKKS